MVKSNFKWTKPVFYTEQASGIRSTAIQMSKNMFRCGKFVTSGQRDSLTNPNTYINPLYVRVLLQLYIR